MHLNGVVANTLRQFFYLLARCKDMMGVFPDLRHRLRTKCSVLQVLKSALALHPSWRYLLSLHEIKTRIKTLRVQIVIAKCPDLRFPLRTKYRSWIWLVPCDICLIHHAINTRITSYLERVSRFARTCTAKWKRVCYCAAFSRCCERRRDPFCVSHAL